MAKMNDFINSNIPKLANFYSKLLVIPGNYYEKTETPELTITILSNSIGYLYNHTLQNKVKLDSVLNGNKQKENIKTRLESIIAAIGDAFEKIKSTPDQHGKTKSTSSDEL